MCIYVLFGRAKYMGWSHILQMREGQSYPTSCLICHCALLRRSQNNQGTLYQPSSFRYKLLKGSRHVALPHIKTMRFPKEMTDVTLIFCPDKFQLHAAIFCRHTEGGCFPEEDPTQPPFITILPQKSQSFLSGGSSSVSRSAHTR